MKKRKLVEKKTTDMETTSVEISFIKKDIKRSPSNTENEHEQLICAFEIRPRHATAITHGLNHLSGTKINKLSETRKKLNKKLKVWSESNSFSIQDLLLFISLELRFRPSEKNGEHYSYYVAFCEKGNK